MRTPDDVARDLTAICELVDALEDQAVAKSTDREIPGGAAMVALAPVASPEAWEFTYEAREERGRDVTHVADHDDDFAPPLQLLLFWSEEWRREHNRESDRRPTVASEAAFIRQCLDWAWEHEVRFEDFADDVATARKRLENVLYAGTRAEHGAPCMYDECRGARLTRTVDDRGVRSDWHCPRCHREWDEDRYAAMVTAAHEASRFEDIDGVTWCSVEYAARNVGRSVKTIRTWRDRDGLETVCIIAGRRERFVRLDQVRERDEKAKRPRGRRAA